MTQKSFQKKVKPLREKIKEIDSRIVKLISQRAEEVVKIGKLKNLERIDFFDPNREKEIYNLIQKVNKGPLPNKVLKAIYREIMSACLSLEKKLLIAYLGPAATFTHQAALAKFGTSVEYLDVPSISDVFSEVESAHADYGVVPIENSTEGAVNHTLDMFVNSNLRICSEILLEICHCLLSRYKKNEIERIYSKSEVFGQCKTWLRANLPTAEYIEVASTTKAAEIALKEKNSAAIASELAASIYRLKVVERAIEDIHQNVTRFLVIGRTESARSGDDKTSIMFSVRDRVGALHDILGIFKNQDINLTMIESRPSRKKAWEYYFFADFSGYISDKNVEEAIEKLEKKCQFVKTLGSYPKGPI